jgi:propanediol dehydratase small subunit
VLTDSEVSVIAAGADIIDNGYAMTFVPDEEIIRVLNLHRPSSSAVFDKRGQLLETTMDDVEVSIVTRYIRRDLKYVGIHVV